MGFFRKEDKSHPFRVISATGFVVSVSSYVVFWGFDTLRPGFVSRNFSVHLFLLSALFFGVAWTLAGAEQTNTPKRDYLMALIGAMMLSVLTWNLGEGFEAFRILMSVIAFILPFSVTGLLRGADSVNI